MRLAITLVAAMLVACGRSDKPHKATSAEKKTPTVEELVADPGTAQEVAPAMQDGSAYFGRTALQPGSGGNT